MSYKLELLEKFNQIRNMGWVRSNRSHNTGIGKTFEDLLGKVEDNKSTCDFGDIEIKTQRDQSTSYVTLFTKAPCFPRGANTLLRKTFGSPNPEKNNLNTLHTSVTTSYNTYRDRYRFKLQVCRDEQKIYLIVSDISTGEVLLDTIYYKFETLQRVLSRKLKKVAYVSASTSIISGVEYFMYNELTLLDTVTFDKFLSLIESGDMMIDIRVGVYGTGKRMSRTHDHGTGFRLKARDFDKLYENQSIF